MVVKDIIIEKFKKQIAIFKTINLISLLAIFVYCMLTILQCETFDTNAVIACSTFAGSIVICLLLSTFFDIKRNRILLKYYGEVDEADRNTAKALLEQIHIVNKNEYDFYDMLGCDTADLPIPITLKLLARGKRIHVELYEPIKEIEQEIKSNKQKYTDEDFNCFIYALVLLLERNVCDI